MYRQSEMRGAMSKQPHHDTVVDVIEVAFYVHLNKPFRSTPYILDVRKGCMTGATCPETMRMNRENRFINDFEDTTHNFLYHAII